MNYLVDTNILSHLHTFNAKDFRSYPGIVTVTPADVLTP